MKKFISKRFHFIIDAFDCDPKQLNDKMKLDVVIRTIAKLCEMNILYGPVILEGLPINPGLTGFAIIDFSHISIHTFTKTNELCVDVFSCKKFDYNIVKKYIKESFKLSDENTKVIDVKHKSE